MTSEDDFAALVSRSNPAASSSYQYNDRNVSNNPYVQQYQPQAHRPSQPPHYNGSYPPPPAPSQPDLMDPFFDDEDDFGPPDSAFGSTSKEEGNVLPMHSQESGLPLARNAAGMGPSSVSLATTTGQPQGWTFDDEGLQPGKGFAGSASFPGSDARTKMTSKEKAKGAAGRRKRKWRFPWEKEEMLVGERVIALNNAPANDEFCNNFVSTSKFNMVTFVPKFLTEQFSKYANLFFLFTACIQQIPGVSPTNKYTTIGPLAAVLLASAFKEVQEDLKRHQSDAELNARLGKALSSSCTFESRKWKDLRVGDVVRVESDEFIPADLVLISSSEPEGLCYIETSNLDGETNLKIKQASPQTSSLTSPHLVANLSGSLRSEQPNNSLYTYEGTLDLLSSAGVPRQVPLGPDQLLLRGAQLRNTPWVYGVVVFTGHETKLMRNATATPIKRTAVEKQVNVHIIFLFCFLLALSIGSTIGASINTWFLSGQQWYLVETSTFTGRAKAFIEDILTFIILYNNLIPISLIVTMEVVKYQQAQLINSDLDMYYARTDTPALCRTSSLVEELGQIEYIFSDKTGTLTRNEMEFRCCSIAGRAYADVVEEGKRGEDGGEDGEGKDGWKTFEELRTLVTGKSAVNGGPFEQGVGRDRGEDMERETAREFLALLAVCHTVIPEIKDGKTVFQASSPDEAALVAGAELLGYQFHTRKPKSVYVNIQSQSYEYQIINVCEFNSTRKRMSTVIRTPDGKIKLYCKGADTVILERLGKNQLYVEKTLTHLEDYATDGLRTLCLAYRDIPEAEYRQWQAIYEQAASTINGRGEALDQAAELIEKDMFLLGATAIEDKLQEGVPDAIHTLQMAGIKIWVLTGDRQETAINIGMSCRLIAESMNLVIINEENARDTEDFILKRVSAIKNQRNSGELEDLALVIDGKSLTFALEKELSKSFLELALMCKAVICCRVSPLQKALVVKLVKKNQKAILLAIGDGANDVSMIQAAHVGVGISGVEGLQAARSADIAISQFRYLKKLLLVHGAWSYQRLSKLILYSFYKNITLYMTQFWYSSLNNFSGQIAYESWTISLYNVLFTVLPPFVIGIFDQFVSARILDRYPQLYALGQKNVFFTKTAFWLWVGNALYHSFVLFGFSVILFWGDHKQSSGLDSGHWFWGTALYLTVLLTVLGKAALISDLWTKYTVAAIPGSFVFTMLFLPLYAEVAPAIGFSTEYYGLVPRLWTDAVFYFMLLFIPIFCLSRDFVWKYYRRTYHPASYHIAQELQKYNIPDYRPRQEQFQKAIKKVRAVQRMRRNRGFAFSQTENGRQDQTKLIRAYDTSKSSARPSGY
ncbi:Ca-transporting ATPase [Hygrophoropsis aurantiaca]|uniref:Ca-transporting ATPase n=1 Tax=Hygrophoropsis aurantiaca TaxID=72124 RepID=A0ACB7ZXU1_9AGAM|nr:Ca-transporting ATPase [Hygrophoropsis aurantiaca]